MKYVTVDQLPKDYKSLEKIALHVLVGPFATAESKANIRHYWKEMGSELIVQKLKAEMPFDYSAPVKVDALTLKRRTMQKPQVKPRLETHSVSLLQRGESVEEQLIGELQLKKWIANVEMVCDGIVGVTLKPGESLSKRFDQCLAIQKRIGYKNKVLVRSVRDYATYNMETITMLGIDHETVDED